MDERGRITVPDVALLLGTFAMVGALYPVFADGFASMQSQMDTATVMLFNLMLPLTLLVIFGVMWRKAVAGGAR
jgi:hypothetical protein